MAAAGARGRSVSVVLCLGEGKKIYQGPNRQQEKNMKTRVGVWDSRKDKKISEGPDTDRRGGVQTDLNGFFSNSFCKTDTQPPLHFFL